MDKNIAPHISALVDSFVPEHIEASYPKLVLFLKAYLNFLEDTNKASYYQNTLPEQRDVWQQEQQFLARIQKEIGLYVPRDYAATPKVFYQKVVDLYRSKGSEAAVKTFFQLFIDDVVEIYYPWEQVLIPSDGRWVVEDKLRVSMLTGDADLFAGQVIRQVASDAVAKVDKVERRVYSDGVIFELTLVKGTRSGTFEAGQTISAVGGLSAEIYKSVSGFNIKNGGSGYVPGDRIRVLGFEGFSFNAFVSFVDPNGAITDIRISNYGAGNTPEHVKDANVSEIFYFKNFDLYRYSNDSQAVDSTLDITSTNGNGADIDLLFDTVVTTAGEYRGVKGQLSESIVIQDSKFYQKYSYEVSTNYSTDIWLDALKRTVHPAGMEVFGNIRLNEFADNSIKSNVIYTATVAPSEYEVLERPVLKSTPLGFRQDYTVQTEVYFSEAYVGTEDFNLEFIDVTESRSQGLTDEVFVTQD